MCGISRLGYSRKRQGMGRSRQLKKPGLQYHCNKAAENAERKAEKSKKSQKPKQNVEHGTDIAEGGDAAPTAEDVKAAARETVVAYWHPEV
jgi:hypothetical protein